MSITELGARILQTALYRFRTCWCICGWDVVLQKGSNGLTCNPAGSGDTADSLLVVMVILVAVCATAVHNGIFVFFITFRGELGRYCGVLRCRSMRSRVRARWISIPRFSEHGIWSKGRHGCATGVSDVVNGACKRGAVLAGCGLSGEAIRRWRRGSGSLKYC